MSKFLFRVDDGPGIGAGHLMRCLALAEVIAQGGGEIWLLTARQSVFHDRWKKLKAHIVIGSEQIASDEDLAFTILFCNQVAVDWLIVDGYRFTSAWLDTIGAHIKTLWVDDMGLYDPAVALVLNHNPGAEQRFSVRYKRCQQSLLGLDWFLLRREFFQQKSTSTSNGILICLGGEDPENRVSQIVQVIASGSEKLSVEVVCGASSLGVNAVAGIMKTSGSRFTVHEGPVQLAPLMSRTKVMICGGGVTALEALSMGLRIVILVLADNQAEGATELAKMSGVRVVEAVGDWAQNVVSAAQQLLVGSEQSRGENSPLLDGQGSCRVLATMQGAVEV